jgi:hypothetical protein
MLGRTEMSNNSLASCAIVAESLLEELRAQEKHEASKVLAQTLLRVLDGYKFGTLGRDQTHHGVLRRTPLTKVFPVSAVQFERVQEALDRASVAIFPGMGTDDAVSLLSGTIRSEFGLPGPLDQGHMHRAELEQFLARLISELEPAA